MQSRRNARPDNADQFQAEAEPASADRSVGYDSRRAPLLEYTDRLAPDAEPVVGHLPGGDRVVELREEVLVARKELQDLGDVEVRTIVEELPRHIEVQALHEEVIVEHEPVGRVVSERVAPWEEDGELVVPVYEEQLVLVKRLVLREQIRVRRVATTATQVFDETVRRERLAIDDPRQTGLVQEHYSLMEDDDVAAIPADGQPAGAEHPPAGLLDRFVRKALF